MKPNPELSHMPQHVLENILDKLDPDYKKLDLRLVSKTFKKVIDKSPITYDYLRIEVWDAYVEIRLGRELACIGNWREREGKIMDIRYSKSIGGFTVCKLSDQFEKRHREGHYLDASMARISKIFKNPNVTVKILEIILLVSTSTSPFLLALVSTLEVLRHLVKVRGMIIGYNAQFNDFLPLLRRFNPDIFEELYLREDTVQVPEMAFVNELMETEQWKKMKRLKIGRTLLEGEISPEKFAHLEKMELRFKDLSFEAMKQFIQNAKVHCKFERLRIFIENLNEQALSEIRNYFNQFPRIDVYKSRIEIPGSSDCLSVSINRSTFKIKRRPTGL